MLIKALLFDLDNTLFEYDDAFTNFIKNLGRRFEFSPNDEEIALILLKNERGYAPRLGFFDWLIGYYGISANSNALWEIMQEDFSNYTLVTNATKKMLKRLSKLYKIGILTNGSSVNQRNKILRTGLGKIVSEIFISGEMDCEKPAVEIFRLACKQIDSSPEQTLYVGDHWENDIEGGKNAGLKTCWLSYGSQLPSTELGIADYVIGTLEELPPILDIYD